MKTRLLFFLLTILSQSFLFAQKSIWSKADESRISLSQYMERRTIPEKYDVWAVDFNTLKNTLDQAPLEFSGQMPLSFDMPLPEQGLVRFFVQHSPVYAPELAAKYPTFKTFIAETADKKYWARLDYTLHGFHAMISTPQGEVYIDPYATDQTTYHIAYFTANHIRKDNPIKMSCGADQVDQPIHFDKKNIAEKAESRNTAETAVIRKYRLVVAATGEFTSKYGGTKAKALSQIVTLANRCTKIFNDELAIRFELVAKNDTMIFTNAATDPYKDGNTGKEILAVSTQAINPRIGVNNYDIGHTLTGQCDDVGGVAFAGVVCTASKGSGMSCDGGGTADQFATNIMCHEMGHQFSASHTMSACGNGTDQSQVASSSAIEPGSGTTIMSYDGSCGTDNVTGIYWKNEGFYSVGSLEQIMQFSRKGEADKCPQKIATNNSIPEVKIVSPSGTVIPISTPFELIADGKDGNGDKVWYSWEQADEGQYIPLGSKKTLYANTFRVFDPVEAPNRIFPRLSDIVAQKQSKTELYPDTSRTYTFRCTVRDLSSGGGGTTWEEMRFKSTHTAGPFRLQYPALEKDTVYNSEYTIIKWDVANTNKAPVNCERVNILLSTDGGKTFPITLLKNTANDGEEGVIIPAGTTSVLSRVRVSAADNIFFNISPKSFYVNNTKKVGYTFLASSEQYTICLPDVANVNIQSSAFGGFASKVKLSVVDGLPPSATATFAKDEIEAGENTTLNIDLKKVVAQGIYNVKVRAIAGTDTLYRIVPFKTIYANFDDMALVSPKDGATGVGTLPSFQWKPSVVAELYDFQIATSPAFGLSTIVYTKNGTKLSDLKAPVTLLENTVYYWRVRPSNFCRNGEYSVPNAFATLVQTCKDINKTDKITIPASSKNSYESIANVNESGIASDINITGIKGNHSDFGDLEFIVESPTGKTATLLSSKCPTISADFNMSFDDESSANFSCSFINSASTFKPATPLSIFKNEDIKGQWKLKVNDNYSGNGGSLTGWNLRFCFSTSVTAPTVFKNDTLRVKKGKSQFVNNLTLEMKDDKSPASKITYTIVKTPENGTLDAYGSKAIVVGSTFTQEELDKNNIIKYNHNGQSVSKNDYFLFTVNDGDGGFIGTLKYNIVTDEKAPNIGTVNIDIDKALSVFPNPASQTVNVNLDFSENLKTTLSLYNIQGQLVDAQVFKQSTINTQFNVQNLPNGIYYLKVNTDKGFASRKIVVQK